MDMNYGCDVSNRYTGYLDSSDRDGNPMNNAAGKNKRKTKKRRKPKNSEQKVVTVVDKCTNTSQIIECDGDSCGPSEQQQQQQQLIDERHNDEHQVHYGNDAQYTDDPTSLISIDSTAQSDTSKELKESDSQSNNTLTEDQPTTTENEMKWSVICCEEEKAAAAAAAAAATAAMDEQKLRDEPELSFKDQRIYPTVYFYNSNFGPRNRRVVYDFHDGGVGKGRRDGSGSGSGIGGGGGSRRYNNYNYRDASRTQQWQQPVNDTQVVTNNPGVDAVPNDKVQNKQKKRRNRNAGRRRRKNYYAGSDTTDYNHPGETSEMQSIDDTEKYSNTSHNESNDRTSYGRSSTTPPAPPPTAQKYGNNSNGPHEYPKNRYNKFKYGMPERTFSRRRTDLVRNV